MQTAAENLLLVTLEQWFRNFLRCHASGFPKLLDPFGVPSSSGLLLIVPDHDDDELLDFDCIDQTYHMVRAKKAGMMIVVVWVVL